MLTLVKTAAVSVAVLCLRHGTRRNIPQTPSPFHSGRFINKTHYKGLIVLSVPNTHPPTVITAYWTVEVKEFIHRCIAGFEQRLCENKKRRDKHDAKNAKKPKKQKKSGSKSTRACPVSVNVDAEDLDDLDY